MTNEKVRKPKTRGMGADTLAGSPSWVEEMGGPPLSTKSVPARNVPSQSASNAPEAVERPAKTANAEPKVKPKAERTTFQVREDLIEAARDAVVALSGLPLRLTLSAFINRAIENEVERLRKEHNKGKPFPQRPVELRPGRPVSGRATE